MGKQVKQMSMDALKKTFQDVREVVLLTSKGVTCQTDNHMRLVLRKKNIHMQVVKNSLARKVFDDLGMKSTRWEGSTVVAWGGNSLAELSRELETFVKKNEKLKVKGVLTEGQEIEFAQALKMPTRPEAIARVIGLALSPASRLVSQILAPAGRIAGQIKVLGEKPAQEEAA